MSKQQFIKERILDMIKNQSLHPGDKLLSVRDAAKMYDVSVTPVIVAYQELVADGVLEARPKSGYYVLNTEVKSSKKDYALDVCLFDIESDMQTQTFCHASEVAFNRNYRYPFALSQMPPHLTDRRKLADTLVKSLSSFHGLPEDLCYHQDTEELTEVLSEWMRFYRCTVPPSGIRVTTGPTQAVLLSIQACCKRTDAVAIETPGAAYYYFAAKLFGCEIVEVPSHCAKGLDVDKLEEAVAANSRIKAVLCSPNFSNPTGSLMPIAERQRLVDFCREKGVAIIETDLDGETAYGFKHPLPVKSLDDENVIYISELGNDIVKINFIAGGKYHSHVRAFGEISHSSVPAVMQIGFAKYMQTQNVRRHFSELREALEKALDGCCKMVDNHFPDGTRYSRPTGGRFIWIELPERIKSFELLEKCEAQGISFSLGPSFSNSYQFENCIRINFALAANHSTMLNGIGMIGDIACSIMEE